MKKSLIALAVLGVSGVAMAQSSVTLYGQADAGIGKVKLNSPGGDAYNKVKFLGSGGTMSYAPSRVGVRGIEDIGGGLQVGFNFETGIDTNNGATIGSGSPGFWGRQANMWVTGSNWGTVKLGRQFAPSYLAVASYDLVGTANYNLQGLAYKYAGVGAARVNSAFAYVTPNFNGLTGVLGYVTKTDMNNFVGVNKAAWDAAVLYANGPISASLDVNKIANSKTNFLVGGRYNFGNFIVGASYTQASDQAKHSRRGFGIGGTALFGPFSATIDLMRDTKNQWGPKKYTNALLELKYNLSKRTFLYGVYLRGDGNYQNNAGATTHGSTNNYSLGIHHNF